VKVFSAIFFFFFFSQFTAFFHFVCMYLFISSISGNGLGVPHKSEKDVPRWGCAVRGLICRGWLGVPPMGCEYVLYRELDLQETLAGFKLVSWPSCPLERAGLMAFWFAS
jgi:hypothetical protein